jgi:hypothetical protein
VSQYKDLAHCSVSELSLFLETFSFELFEVEDYFSYISWILDKRRLLDHTFASFHIFSL